MKRLCALLLALLLLAGCGAGDAPATAPVETVEPVPGSILDGARPWSDGVVEVTLNVPNLWNYNAMLDFNGSILLWCVDTHGTDVMELCRVAMDGSFVTARVALPGGAFCDHGTLAPQALGEYLYVCDNLSGTVTRLDADLNTVNTWSVTPTGGIWTMGENGTLYQFCDTELWSENLSTGQRELLFTGDRWGESNGYLILTQEQTGITRFYTLDLTDGTLQEQPISGNFHYICRAGEQWLCLLSSVNGVAYLHNSGESLRLQTQDCDMTVTGRGEILVLPYDSTSLQLYDGSGKFLARCDYCDDGSYYAERNMVWSGELGGYFFRVNGWDGAYRLLFWDLSAESTGEDLQTGPLPGDSLTSLRQRADALEQTYGVEILLGEECDLEYWDFVANAAVDWERVNIALDELETALAGYPDGFLRQLQWNSVTGVRIELVQDLEATDYRAGRSYQAFVSDEETFSRMVVDVDGSDASTYYHEFSHVIDSYLDWYECYADDPVYTAVGWEELNPDEFWYSYDYTADGWWFDEEWYQDYFIDTYATISPTEDRARVMEYAMSADNAWWFEEHPGLAAKLEYYCTAIRAVFDTTGWPETALWEQYLMYVP